MRTKNRIFPAKLPNGNEIKVYMLKQATPTKDHVWANYETGGRETYTNDEIKVSI